jgi:hypothetical protein
MKRHDIRVVIVHTFNLQNTGITTSKPHRSLVFVIKLLFKILEVEDQAFIGLLRRLAFLQRCLADATWGSIVASIWRRGICMHFMNT